jgi:hypothetical protein
MHAVYFARALAPLIWQPTDQDAEALASIEAWRNTDGTENLLAPVHLDVLANEWPVDSVDAVFNANMIHISPAECTAALLKGASAHLSEGGPLVVYGPFRIGGAHTAPSNERFDASLRSRDPRWGVRDLETVVELAAGHGLLLERRVEMPANNQTLVFRRTARSS